ncbi:g10148 [Coccomyxa elongata]
MEYVAAGRESSFQTNLVATSIYYLLWGVLAVGSTALEMWLFPSIEFGVERLAAMYHETEFARLWDQRSARLCQPLREAAARHWGCSESNVHAHQLHIRTSFSAVRTIANRLREEKGRFEEAPLEVDMRLPLLQNITSTSKAEEDFKLFVHMEHELQTGFFQRVHLSRSSYSATGNASWRQGVRLNRPGEARLAQQDGEAPLELQSRAPSSPDSIVRLDSRAGAWEMNVGGSPRGVSHRADQPGVALQGMSVGDNAV